MAKQDKQYNEPKQDSKGKKGPREALRQARKQKQSERWS